MGEISGVDIHQPTKGLYFCKETPILALLDFRVQCEEQIRTHLLLDLALNESHRVLWVFLLRWTWSAALTAFRDARLDVDHV